MKFEFPNRFDLLPPGMERSPRVELRLPPLISHKETAPSRQSRQKNPSAPIY